MVHRSYLWNWTHLEAGAVLEVFERLAVPAAHLPDEHLTGHAPEGELACHQLEYHRAARPHSEKAISIGPGRALDM